MAKRSTSVVQTDFALGATRPDSVERTDTDLVGRGVKEAKNTIIESTGAMSCRPGSFFKTTVNGYHGYEIEPENGAKRILVPKASGLDVYTADGALVVSFATASWTLSQDIWVDPLGETTLIGSTEVAPHALVYEDGAFTFGPLAFAAGSGGSLAQPYWAYESAITLTPSALTGTVTLTTDVDYFNPLHVGQRIRYVGREILITVVTDARTATGTVQQELPPTKVITVADTSGFLVDDAVEHETLGGQGVITDITGSNITVLVTKFFTGFDGNGADLVAPNAKANITGNAAASSPAGTKNWDEPLMSPLRGYPGSSSEHKGRVIFCDFPQVPNAIALSAAGTINDFRVGTNDDDAIVDTITASQSTRVLHAVSAEDLLILTTRGLFYQETRSGNALTPAVFDPNRFDNMGASSIRPAQVHDGVVFVAANGQNIYAAVLQGDIYKAWTTVPVSEFHEQHINTPVWLDATDSDSDRPERYIFCVNTDGTAAIMRWERGSNTQDTVGWVPWETTGTYKSLFMANGKIFEIAIRAGNNVLSQIDDAAFLDAAVQFDGGILAALSDENGLELEDENGLDLDGITGGATHLVGSTVAVFDADWDYGDYTVNSDGLPVDGDDNYPTLSMGQIGLTYEMAITPWTRRSVQAYNERRESRRLIRMSLSVHDTLQFSCNGQDFGGYRAGEDLSVGPARRTEHVHFYPGVRDHYQNMRIVKTRPGPFTMTSLTYKVQV